MAIEIVAVPTAALVPPSSFILIFRILDLRTYLRGVLFVMLKSKTKKSPHQIPPFDTFSDKLKIKSII